MVMPWAYSTAALLIFMAVGGLEGWYVVRMDLVCIVVGINKGDIRRNQYKVNYPGTTPSFTLNAGKPV